MEKRQKTGGRKAGVPNKTTASVKAALEASFERLGGVDSLVDWARENQTEFYKLYARLLPAELNVNATGLENLGDRLERAAKRNS